MACHNPSVIEAILTGHPYPVRAMYVSGVNIVVTYPNARKTTRALESLDFLAVATQTMTPTAELADLVLPKTTTLEEEEVALNPAGPCLTYTRPAVAPLGEARSDIDIAVALIDRLEARGALARNVFRWRTPREFCRYLLAGTDIDLEALAQRGFATYPHRLGNFDEQRFNTPTGKVELFSVTLEQLGLDPLPDLVTPVAERGPDVERVTYPLVLLTGDREKAYHHSRFREQEWARRISPDPDLRVHPETAAAHGVSAGDWVFVETPTGPGRCRLRVDVTDATPPGVVSTGMGWWWPEAPLPDRGALDVNVNAAMSYDGPWDPISGSADTRGMRCRLSRAPG